MDIKLYAAKYVFVEIWEDYLQEIWQGAGYGTNMLLSESQQKIVTVCMMDV